MAVMAYEIDGGKLNTIESFGDITLALSELREFWCEEPDDHRDILLLGDDNHVEAVLSRDCDDPEVCITTFIDGAIERHRCHYVLAADGRYDRTEITNLIMEAV